MKNKHSIEKEIAKIIEDIQQQLERVEDLKEKDIYHFIKLSTILSTLEGLNEEGKEGDAQIFGDAKIEIDGDAKIEIDLDKILPKEINLRDFKI